MNAAAVVIPLAAMAIPIVLILLAVLFDALYLIWFAYRMWHDVWAARVADAVVRPIRGFLHPSPLPKIR